MSRAAIVATAMCAAAAVLLSGAPSASAGARLGVLGRGFRPNESSDGSERTGWASRSSVRYTVAGLLAAAVYSLVGGVTGLIGAVAAAGAMLWWLGRLPDRAEVERRTAMGADLPVAADLLACCLAAGSTIEQGLAAVAGAVGGPLGAELQRTVSLLRMGADPERAWRAMMGDPALAPLARALLRSVSSGAPVASVIDRLADEQRSARRWAAEAVARRVGVLSVAPLGLCFLPAFLALGIVPMVLGMAEFVAPAFGP